MSVPLNEERALGLWTELQHRPRSDAYVEESLHDLENWAEKQGLEFCYSHDTKTWSLEPNEQDSIDTSTLITELRGIRLALEESNKIAKASHDEMMKQQAKFHEESTRGLRQAEQNSKALREQLNAKQGVSPQK